MIPDAYGSERNDDTSRDAPRRQHLPEKQPSNQCRKHDARLSDRRNRAGRPQGEGHDHDAVGHKRDQSATQRLQSFRCPEVDDELSPKCHKSGGQKNTVEQKNP